MTQTQLATAELTPQAQDVFGSLWTSLFYAPQTPPKAVLVCSSDKAEGATTVACGLALAGSARAISGANATASMPRVVLVDFNMRTPSVSERFNIANGLGVSNVLVGETELDQALQRIEPGQLDILTAGSQCSRVLEVLQVDRVRKFLDQLQQRYDCIIIDTAPVNQYPDTQVLADAVGFVVLVVRYLRTHREALLQAKKRLELGSGKVLGVVLNARTYPIPSFVYRRV